AIEERSSPCRAIDRMAPWMIRSRESSLTAAGSVPGRGVISMFAGATSASPRRLLIIAALGTALLTATACGGSALDPNEVLAANRAVNGTGTGSAGGPGAPVTNPDGTAVDPG